MKKCKRLLALFLCLISIITIFSATALNSFASTSGSGKTWYGIQVWTNKSGSTPYVTITQSPAKYNYYKNGKLKQADVYEQYFVVFVPKCTVDGKKTNAQKVSHWIDSSNHSYKFKLQKGVYYEVSIEHYAVSKLPSHDLKRNTWYSQNSSWSISKINNCSNYR